MPLYGSSSLLLIFFAGFFTAFCVFFSALVGYFTSLFVCLPAFLILAFCFSVGLRTVSVLVEWFLHPQGTTPAPSVSGFIGWMSLFLDEGRKSTQYLQDNELGTSIANGLLSDHGVVCIAYCAPCHKSSCWMLSVDFDIFRGRVESSDRLNMVLVSDGLFPFRNGSYNSCVGPWRTGCPPWDCATLNSYSCFCSELCSTRHYPWRRRLTRTFHSKTLEQLDSLLFPGPWRWRTVIAGRRRRIVVLNYRSTAVFTFKYWTLVGSSKNFGFLNVLFYRVSANRLLSAKDICNGSPGLLGCFTARRRPTSYVDADAEFDTINKKPTRSLFVVVTAAS